MLNASPPCFHGVLVDASLDLMLLLRPMLELRPVLGLAAGDFGILRACGCAVIGGCNVGSSSSMPSCLNLIDNRSAAFLLRYGSI